MAVDGWLECNIGDIASAFTGFAFKSDDFIDREGVPVVRMSNLKSGCLDFTDVKRVPRDVVNGLKKYSLEAGDFLFGMSGSLGNYAVVKPENLPCYLNQRVGKLVAKSADYNFLKHLYLSEIVQNQIDLIAAGAAQKNISANQIESIKIDLPPLPEQKKIAAILSSVDNAIAKTEAVIDQTRRVKQGLLQELLTRGIGHTKFKQSEIGEIPEEWSIATLNEVTHSGKGLQTGPFGSQLHAHDYSNNGYAVLMPKDLANMKANIVNASKIPEHIWEKMDKHVLKEGDIIFSRRGDVGRCALISKNDEGAICGTGCLRARLDPKKVNAKYLIQFLHLPIIQGWLKDNAVGQTMPNLNTTILGSIPILLPPLSEQLTIYEAIESFDVTECTNGSNLNKLLSLKKGLLSDLLTGRVRVNIADFKEKAA